jgi:hypothetical protein
MKAIVMAYSTEKMLISGNVEQSICQQIEKGEA